jgi:7-cyano-7-deazaguanine reductase
VRDSELGDMDRFLNSSTPAKSGFEALSRRGSDHYIGLETFPNPGCHSVTYISDEVMSRCPITGQPDFYNVEIILAGTDNLIESKSLKLFFQGIIDSAFKDGNGIFCEALAVYIRDQVCEALNEAEESVQVSLIQKSRGGISIRAIA